MIYVLVVTRYGTEEDGFYGRPWMMWMTPKEAITRIFRAYGSGKGPEFWVKKRSAPWSEEMLQMTAVMGEKERNLVFFTGPAGEMEILFRAADRLATARSGDRTLVAMMLREGITLSADINRGLELTVSELGLALESHRRSELSFGRIVDIIRSEYGRKTPKK